MPNSNTPVGGLIEEAKDPAVSPPTRGIPPTGDLTSPAAGESGAATIPTPAVGEICRGCGCSDPLACEGADGLPCSWVERGLCTSCAGITTTELVGRVQRQTLMGRLVEIALQPELCEGDAPRHWLVVAHWDGRGGAAGRTAVVAPRLGRDARDTRLEATLLEAALLRLQSGETPVEDPAPRGGTPEQVFV